MRFLLALLAWLAWGSAAAASWLLASDDGSAAAGERFEVVLVAPEGEALPEEIVLLVKLPGMEVRVPARGAEQALPGRRTYGGIMPPGAAGPARIELAGLRRSNVLVLLVEKRDAVHALAGRESRTAEPPLSENEPMYFVLGLRDGASARFQLSFKYRLFDQVSGFGRERPWLAGFYFAYTQSSLWDLSSESRAFRDTSYRPSFYWQWERFDSRAWLDGLRIGVEHESNGRDGPRSRSLDTLFVRPQWRRETELGAFEFTPRLNAYIDKDENPDIQRYRGAVDWRLKWDSGVNWTATGVARVGTAGHGSVLLDVSRRTRDLRIGPISGYLHAQYFNGYGEDILGYNARRKAQLRLGVAIVP